jgi:septal ring factor EnvC (AmiA/AmiB activator)
MIMMRVTRPSFAAVPALIGSLFFTGCVETAVYEKTAAQLDASMKAAAQKDQQIRGLEWQVAVLAQQVREAELRAGAAQRETAAQLRELAAQNAALMERIKKEEEDRRRLVSEVAADDGKKRPEDLRRLLAAVDAQNARLLERLGKLEQKIDARGVEAPRKAPGSGRTIDADIVDPWGFGARH